MNWTEEQLTEALRRYIRASEVGKSGPAAVMDYAAELLAAPNAPHPNLPPEAFHESKGLDAEALPACADGTCNHYYRGTPGHAAELVERSQAFNEVGGLEFAVSLQDACACRKGALCHLHSADGLADDGKMNPAMEAAYDTGAEAMRAACWEDLQAVFAKHGLARNGPFFWDAKAAIDGAAP